MGEDPMEITGMQTKAFWKGEVGISGQVKDGREIYKVRLEVKGSYVNSCSCSCARGNSYKDMCPHEKALFAHYMSQASQRPEEPVSTSSQVRAMIREYTNKDVEQILMEDEHRGIGLVPRILIGRREIKAEFRLCRDRQYVIKDLAAFARAMGQGTYGEYGKNLAFHHTMEAFSPESRELLGLVLELAGTYEECCAQFQKSIYSPGPSMRELTVTKSIRDRFFALLAEKEVEAETPGGIRRTVKVVRRNPGRMVAVRRLGRQGLNVSIDKEICTFLGERHLYVQKGDYLYICDEDLTRDGSVFFSQMTQGYAAPYEAAAGEKDAPLFWERVLRRLNRHGLLDTGDLDLESLRPQKLKARFDLENPAPGQVVLTPILSYGEYSFHPVEDVKLPRSICRDVPGEFYISQILTRYFKYKDPVTNDLMIKDDEEALFLFLSQGVEQLKALGEVRFLQEGRGLKILKPPKVSVGVQAAEHWLDLTIEAEGMTAGDMAGLLEAYRQKKPYFRLKGGNFLRLEDNGLLAVVRMADGLGLSKKDLGQTCIRLPRYRALYLDGLFREQEDIRFMRDERYKSMVRGMRSVKDSDLQAPKEMDAVLRDYQKTGFRWLKTLDMWGFGGLLADDMGLGKTIQIISILADAAARKEERTVQSLIVCPASLVYNWQCEIEAFAPSLKSLMITGPSKERADRLLHAQGYDVIITSYDLLRRDLPLYQGFSFRFQVIDEAQYIKNPGTQNARAVKSVRAATKYALTGTPVENRLGELWSIFDFVMPGFLFSYQKFKKDYEVPVAREGDQKALERLKQLTAPFILRRLKSDVLKELPGKLESVVYSRMEEEQKQLYTAHAWQLRQQLLTQAGEGDKLQILASLTRIRQVCCDPRLVYEDYRAGSAKLETCMELVMSGIEAGHKILLFSQFASMLRLIGERLQKEGVRFYMLTGQTPGEERQAMVDAFHRDGVPVFLISLKAGGTGLNLTAADMVIHYDPWWNAAAQNQATDRAHRIGQEKQVLVFRLVVKDTIEENILKLQRAKEALAGQVVTEGMVSLGSLSQEELMGLLE